MDGTSNILPVYVALHQLEPVATSTFEDVFIQREDLRAAIIKDSSSTSRRVRLYLDGLDEIPDSDRQAALMNVARDAIARRRDLQVIVTGREHVKGPWLSWLPRLRIADLAPGQVMDLVRKWVDGDESKIKAFFAQLSTLPALQQLMCVPLLGTLIIAVFRRTGTVPASKLHLYSLFVELHCGGWDLVKNVRRVSRFGSHDKELILSRFAAKLHYDKQRDGRPDSFRHCVGSALPGFASHWDELLTEVLEDGLLTRVGSQLVFSHLSFQEYLTARYVAAEPEGHRATTILRLFLRGDDWWREVLSFYVGMYSHPQETLQWLTKYRQLIDMAGVSPDETEARYQYLLNALKSVYPACAENFDSRGVSKARLKAKRTRHS
jgi:hypothetical protein